MAHTQSGIPTDNTLEATSVPFPTIKNVPPFAPFAWLAAGMKDMWKHPGSSLFYGFCFAAMGLLITSVFEHAYQYASALTSGFLLLGPCVAMGLYEISRQSSYGLPHDFGASLKVWKKNAGNLAIFSLILIILFLIWARASLILFALFYTNEMPNLTGFLSQILSMENIEFLAIYFGVGFIFASIVFGLSIISIPLMMDRELDAITSMLASIATLLRNPIPCCLWAILIVLLTLAGFASFHLGLIVTMPIVGHATWHAYRSLLEPKIPQP